MKYSRRRSRRPYLEGDMSTQGFDATRATRRWTAWLSVPALAWAVVALFVVPAVIRSAHSDGVFGFLGVLMSGRGQHPVERYLGHWYDFALLGLIGLFVTWLAGVVVLQPTTWRLLRSAWARVPTFGGRVRRQTVAVVASLVAITAGINAWLGYDDWDDARGHEYEAIAQSIVSGHGFAFPPERRWLYLDDEPGQEVYGPTAWKEPIYPYFLAGWFEAAGPRIGRVAIVLCQIALLLVTCLLLYRLGDRLFGPPVGTLAALGTALIVDLHWIASLSIQVPAVSGLLLVAGLLLLFRYLESPTLRFATGIGLFLGLATLTHAVLILLVPIAVIFVFLHGREGTRIERARPAVLIGVAAALTIMPWTVRNYAQFGHVIPVQTGFGLFANVTTPYLAETYDSGLDACGDGTEAVFEAEGPLDGLMQLRKSENFFRTWRRGMRCVSLGHADVYTTLNEHERDRLHREQLLRFVRERPRQFTELTVAKSLAYLLDIPVNGRGSIPLAALGLTGAAVIARHPRMWVFPAVVLAYSVPFILTAPIYYRYRAPLTPLLTLLAVVLVWRLLERPVRRVRVAWGNGPQKAEVRPSPRGRPRGRPSSTSPSGRRPSRECQGGKGLRGVKGRSRRSRRSRSRSLPGLRIRSSRRS